MTNTNLIFSFPIKGQLFLLDIISIRSQIHILHQRQQQAFCYNKRRTENILDTSEIQIFYKTWSCKIESSSYRTLHFMMKTLLNLLTSYSHSQEASSLEPWYTSAKNASLSLLFYIILYPLRTLSNPFLTKLLDIPLIGRKTGMLCTLFSSWQLLHHSQPQELAQLYHFCFYFSMNEITNEHYLFMKSYSIDHIFSIILHTIISLQ